ncbi:MAG: SRPBCC family protein [Planctomycetota bacterium]|jgi:uncharacterized protein YndB with AHSA1/START domain
MADILHNITIEASSEIVFEALTTSEGLKGWWSADSEAEPKVGSLAVFGFFNRTTVLRMRIDELAPPKRVKWTCEGDVDEWVGTELQFDLEPQEEGGTIINFRHGGWQTTEGIFAECNTTWGHLMFRLKAYAEGKNPGPLFVVDGWAA